MNKQQYHIKVEVKTTYVQEQSEPENNRFVFAYTITITNTGQVPAQLLSRHWVITDANNKVQEVRGEGVVGEQPYLTPGDSFRYTSAAMLETPVGCMQGNYQMIADDGVEFDAEIPVFNLSTPHTIH
ncbi:MAG: Co2+/Mg2+ efflux protein ApaG [Gammaproteobacteria bacterium RIFCSPLOWO2_01_FULL_47_190]|jgi:ApaG protein|nr:MAG: Co2+/Mg2+ efflux protein ApaG [Gammaproteobacteria bacterium RIFCSPLOWO2_01_FULL_47_190]OGT73976.1 MAG: Co2+/Mg2+ efflux protein ApaG [Gammaproteobacteria bacterium RIFCSPLOWO2_12_47_11]OGT84650.1 MAG: Co2+/Mg2+ efflux protein ApaG [Gammaproteobacteria bacterium RIFCSPLOWO2_12_FULL_47_76]